MLVVRLLQVRIQEQFILRGEVCFNFDTTHRDHFATPNPRHGTGKKVFCLRTLVWLKTRVGA
jgi:hypothetical protein